MNAVRDDIAALEERLRQAELGPDPKFFEEVLADDVVLVGQDGEAFFATELTRARRPASR